METGCTTSAGFVDGAIKLLGASSWVNSSSRVKNSVFYTDTAKIGVYFLRGYLIIAFFIALFAFQASAEELVKNPRAANQARCKRLISWLSERARQWASQYPEYDASSGYMDISNEEMLKIVHEYQQSKSKASKDKFFAAHLSIIETIIITEFPNFHDPNELVGVSVEALSKVLDRLPVDIENPKAYTWTTVRNRILDYIRAQKRLKKKMEKVFTEYEQKGREKRKAFKHSAKEARLAENEYNDQAQTPDASMLIMSKGFIRMMEAFRQTLHPAVKQFFDDMLINVVAESDAQYARMRGVPEPTIRALRLRVKRAFLKYIQEHQIDLAP